MQNNVTRQWGLKDVESHPEKKKLICWFNVSKFQTMPRKSLATISRWNEDEPRTKFRLVNGFQGPLGAAVVERLSSKLVEQEVRVSISGLATWISEIGYLLLPSRDMAEILLKRRISAIHPTNPRSVRNMVSRQSRGAILKLTWKVIYHWKRQPYFFLANLFLKQGRSMSWLILFAWANSGWKERKPRIKKWKFLPIAGLELTTPDSQV